MLDIQKIAARPHQSLIRPRKSEHSSTKKENFQTCAFQKLLVHNVRLYDRGRAKNSVLHLVHAFASVPVQESLAPEHRCEKFCYSHKHFLKGCGVSQECDRHLQALRWNVTDGSLDVVGNPTKYEKFLGWTFNSCSSTSFVDTTAEERSSCSQCAQPSTLIL